MYNFNPMTEDEFNQFQLIEDGVYDFTVAKSTRKQSKQGNDMAELQLLIDNNLIFDYLVFSKVPLNIKKVKHFCDTTGLEDDKKGALPETLERLKGKVHIGIQEEQPKFGGGFYPKKNIVIDYVVTDKGAVKVPLSGAESFVDSDIPF